MSLEDLHPRDFLKLTEAHLRRHVLSRRAALAGLGVAAASSLLPTPAQAQAQTPRHGGVLRIGRVQEPDTLDPHKTSLAVAESTMLLILEPLARRDPDGKVIPALAQAWEFRDNNRSIVFHLRPGVTFHDGTPVDAAACVFTANRQMDKATASPTTFMLGPLDKVEAIDPQTVVYHYRQPFVPIWVGLTLSYCAILSPTAVAAEKERFGRKPVGAGPFKAISWSPDAGLKLARFDAYKCGPLPYVDEVHLTQYPEDSTRVAALVSGEIQGIYTGQSVPLDRVRSLRSNADIKLSTRPSQSIRALDFNQSLAPINDIRVRQAIYQAIDPKRVITLALDGNAKVAHGPMPSAIPGYDAKVEQMGFPYDPAKAKALLAEAGVGSGLQLKLICNDSPDIRNSAEVVQAMLREVGVTLSVQSMPIGQVVVLTKKAEHHMYLYTYTYPDPDVLYPVFASNGSLQRNFVNDPALDKLLEASRVEFDAAKRQALYDEIQETLMRKIYWVPLFEPLNVVAFAKSVQNVELRSDSDVDLTKVWLST